MVAVFQPRSSGVRSDRFANCATALCINCHLFNAYNYKTVKIVAKKFVYDGMR